MNYYEELAKKYFDDSFECVEDASDNIIDKIVLSYDCEYNKKMLRSRSELIEICDIIINNNKLFTNSLQHEFQISKKMHCDIDIDKYQYIPDSLQEYMNDTYDPTKKRIKCYFDHYDDTDDNTDNNDDYIIIEITKL